jgi:hypothetical protein
VTDSQTTFRKPLALEQIPLPEGGGFTHDALDPELKIDARDEHLAAVRSAEEARLLIYQRGAEEPGYRKAILEMCKRDPIFFINLFVWTFDDRTDEGAVPLVLYEFQELKIVAPFVRCCETKAPARSSVGIAKSRGVGFTWVVLALIVWRWLFYDNWSTLIGSENRDDVDDGGQDASQQSLFGKIRFIIDHFPKWFRDETLGPMIRKEENNKRWHLRNPLKKTNVIHGKQLGGMFGRSRRYSLVFGDEVAWVEEMKDADTSLKQTTNRFFFGSTPKGKNNFFYQAMFGELRLTRVWIWWAENPFLGLDWYNEQRQDMDDETIAQELDISFERSAGGRVLHEVVTTKWFLPNAHYTDKLPLEICIDPGFADHLAAIWCQYDEYGQQGRVVDSIQTNRVSVDWIVPFILGRIPTHTYRGDPWPHHYNEQELAIIQRHNEWEAPEFVMGDKAGGAKNIVTASSAWEELDKYGIFVAEVKIPSDIEALRHLNLMMRHIRFADYLLHQRNGHKNQCPTMGEVVTQWRFPKAKEGSTTAPKKPVHDIYCHLGDCLKMWAWEHSLPDASQMPADAGRVVKNQGGGIIDQPYRSPFRSR